MNRTVWILAIGLMTSASLAADDATPRGERLAQLEIFSDGYPVEVARRMTVSVPTDAKPKWNATFVNTRPD
jgi:hypothetical protein